MPSRAAEMTVMVCNPHDYIIACIHICIVAYLVLQIQAYVMTVSDCHVSRQHYLHLNYVPREDQDTCTAQLLELGYKAC